MSGAKHRRKGDRIEREIVDRHKAMSVHAERYPLSGASRFRGSGHDTDIYAFGRDQAPLVAEVKGRKSGSGFTLLENWLGEYDLLFLRRDHADPLVVVPWRVWEMLLKETNPCPKTSKENGREPRTASSKSEPQLQLTLPIQTDG